MNNFFKIIIVLLFVCNSSTKAQERVALGKVKSFKLTEISGIIPYGHHSGYFWVHNDSGDKANIYLIDSLGNLIQTVNLKGVKAVDWEDIGRVNYQNEPYLVIGDIGNNLKNRDTLSLYIIKEPRVNLSKTKENILEVKITNKINFTYSDKNHDAEALFVDEKTNSIYIVSKRDFKSILFKLPFDINSTKTYNVKPLLELPLTFAVSADISNNGDILIKNLTNIFYWKRLGNDNVEKTLLNTPISLPYLPEPQGEAICFDLNNKSFYTISERPFGLDSYLYKYNY